MWRIVAITLIVLTTLFGVSTAVFFAAYPLRYGEEIISAAEQFDIEPDLIASIIRAESNFRADAVSHKGALGLMQVLPSTALWMGEKIGIVIDDGDMFNPEINIIIGTAYLRYLLDKFNDLDTALIAYNAGEGNVARWLRDDEFAADGKLTHSPFPETNAYVKKVNRARWIYRLRI